MEKTTVLNKESYKKNTKVANVKNLRKINISLLKEVTSVQSYSNHEERMKEFIKNKLQLINEKNDPVVFILWGNNAIQKKSLITNNKHLILTSTHPSPLSAFRGFFGSRPFSKTNDFLMSIGKPPIDWQIENI